MKKYDSDSEQFDFNRRDFLKGTSIAAMMAMMGGVELRAQDAKAPAAKADSDEKKPVGPPVKIGVIGLGAWGRDIATALSRLPNAPITAVCDTYAASLRRADEAAPKAEKFEDYRKLLESKEVDAVIVATPSHQHKEVVLAALQAGKHVYCESPMSSNIEEAKAIAQAAKASKQIFQVGQQFRANPQHHHVFQFVRTNSLGKVAMVRSQWHKKGSWRRASPNPEREKALNWRLSKETSSGLVGELGIHPVDVASWYFNALPVAVTGFGAIVSWADGRDVADTAQAVFEYPSGAKMVYHATLANSFEGNYDAYYGTDSAIVLRENRAWMFKEADSPLLGWEVYARKDEFFGSGETGIALVANASKLIAQGKKPAEAASETDTPLFYSLEEFVANINEKKAPSCGYKEGFQAAVVAIKGNESVISGKRIEFDKAWFEI